MALTTGNPVLASDMNSLKSRYNSEMARRKYTGSLASYNNSFRNTVQKVNKKEETLNMNEI